MGSVAVQTMLMGHEASGAKQLVWCFPASTLVVGVSMGCCASSARLEPCGSLECSGLAGGVLALAQTRACGAVFGAVNRPRLANDWNKNLRPILAILWRLKRRRHG